MKLSKPEIAQVAERGVALNNAFEGWSSAVDTYNATVREAHAALVTAFGDYREVVEGTRAWCCEDVAQGLRSEWDDYSEKCQKSDIGMDASVFVGQWEQAFEGDELSEPNAPEEITAGTNPADLLSALPVKS